MFKEEYKNQKFGTLTLTGNYEKKKYSRSSIILVECICECGNNKFKYLAGLTNGRIKTCSYKCIYSIRIKHGHTKRINEKIKVTKEYAAWKAFKNACKNKMDKRYKNLGEKGITYCKEFETFKGFIDIIGLAPSKNHRLLRINKKGNFEPENVQWKLCKKGV